MSEMWEHQKKEREKRLMRHVLHSIGLNRKTMRQLEEKVVISIIELLILTKNHTNQLIDHKLTEEEGLHIFNVKEWLCEWSQKRLRIGIMEYLSYQDWLKFLNQKERNSCV